MASHSEHDSSSNTSGLVVTSIVFFSIMALFFVALKGSDEGKAPSISSSDDLLKWPERSLDPKTLAAQRAPFFVTPLKANQFETEEFKALTKAFRIQNDHLFKTAPIPAKTVGELSTMFAQSVDAILPTLANTRQYGQLVDAYIPECQKSLDALLEDIKAGKITMALATKDPNIATYATYRQYCGNILGILFTLGLVSDKGAWLTKDAKFLPPLLQRMRWARAGAPGVQEPIALSPSDKIAFTRWQIESPTALAPKQSMIVLSRTPDAMLPYPKLQAQAILHMRSGKPQFAREALQKLAKAQPKLSAAVAKTLAKMPKSPAPK